MLDHLSTYATNYERTKAFYLHALTPLGAKLVAEFETENTTTGAKERVCAFGQDSMGKLWIIETPEPYTPRHLAFSAISREQVDAFHAAAIAAGGEDNGTPGVRPHYHDHYYGAFVLDPDGNNIEAVCHTAP